jgi:hypothetical protein
VRKIQKKLVEAIGGVTRETLLDALVNAGRVALEAKTNGGGYVTDLANALADLEAIGGMWSFTLTWRKTGVIEVHLLRVTVEAPRWRGPGFRQPKASKAKPVIAGKMVFLGDPADLVGWMNSIHAKLERERNEARKGGSVEAVKVETGDKESDDNLDPAEGPIDSETGEEGGEDPRLSGSVGA